MNDNNPTKTFEHNMAALLRTTQNPSKSDLEDRLIHAVLDEVRRQQPAQRVSWLHTRALRWTAALTAAASLIVVMLYGYHPSQPEIRPETQSTVSAGEVRTLYGMVEFKTQDEPARKEQVDQTILDQWTSIPVDAHILTRWGSQAEVRLSDQSRILSRPQTMLTVERGRSGERIILDKGWISVEAAHQEPGKLLQVQTPGACISVLGTKFDVHVVQKANGHRQTRVSVASGKVEMESGGQKIFLTPNTEGIAEEDQIPVRRCLTPEVNELLRLNSLGERLANEQQATPGTSSLIEFHVDGTATVWLMTTLKKQGEITLKVPVKEVAVYTMTGESLPASLDEQGTLIRLKADPVAVKVEERLILRLGGITELFSPKGKGAFELIRTDQNASVISLCQIWLPESANIEEIQPKPIETARSLSRQTFTLAVHALSPDLIE